MWLFGLCVKKQKPESANLSQEFCFFNVDTTGPHNAAVTKAVYGVCVDPHDGHRIASFAEVSNLTVQQSHYNWFCL